MNYRVNRKTGDRISEIGLGSSYLHEAGKDEGIKALRAAGVACKVMVGGAVVTQEFADLIGADYYTKDAAQSAKVAGEVFG